MLNTKTIPLFHRDIAANLIRLFLEAIATAPPQPFRSHLTVIT
ncbi:hypothetical protein [Picosynechococcus sp. NKBG15041c]|nr:hypothetical protein [Picosynechococcus sp. NKBG15041c]